MIQKLIDYIQSKIPIVISDSNTTNSRYIKCNDRSIRISDHFGNIKDLTDLVVIIPETPKTFIISLGYKVYCYSSLRKTGDFIINYILISNNIPDKYTSRIKHQTSEISRLQKLNQDLQNLNQNLMNNRVNKSELTALQKKQKQLESELKEKETAIKEAVDLIDTITTDPNVRELLYSRNNEKRYYLDNFPKEAQELLKDIIKEYYGVKTSG